MVWEIYIYIYIYVGKRTPPRTLFVHNCMGKICTPSPRDHDRASELVPLSLFTNIFGIFFVGRSGHWQACAGGYRSGDVRAAFLG